MASLISTQPERSTLSSLSMAGGWKGDPDPDPE